MARRFQAICCESCGLPANARFAFSLMLDLPPGWKAFEGSYFCGWRCLRVYIDRWIAAEDQQRDAPLAKARAMFRA